jgi:hypothetical protein
MPERERLGSPGTTGTSRRPQEGILHRARCLGLERIGRELVRGRAPSHRRIEASRKRVEVEPLIGLRER